MAEPDFALVSVPNNAYSKEPLRLSYFSEFIGLEYIYIKQIIRRLVGFIKENNNIVDIEEYNDLVISEKTGALRNWF